jgi:SpoVK/Ycf46/Vps4 family AAA+-type ATPase
LLILRFVHNLIEEEREYAKKHDNFVVLVEEDHFLRALQRLQPSVSEIELKHYKQLRDQFTKKDE